MKHRLNRAGTRGSGVLTAACLGLAGCAFQLDYPLVTEAVLSVSGHKVSVESLYCNVDGSVVAAGYTDSLTNLEGVAFFSADRGANWRQASVVPPASGVPLSLLALPHRRDADSLYLSGYRHGQTLLSGVMTFAYEPAPWWTTSDLGQSWHRTEALLPRARTRVIFARMPTVITVDRIGTLATMVDDQHDGLVLLRSTDGGVTWNRQLLPALVHYGSMVSDGAGLVVVTGRSTQDRGVIHWSSDSGTTWAESRLLTTATFPFRLPAALRLYRSPAGALIAFNNDHLGKGKSSTWFFRSVDEGRTWTFVQGINRLGRIVGISGDARGRMIAVTEWAHVLLSDDGGATWRQGLNPIVAKTELGASNVISSPEGVVLATLDRATFIRSTDRGDTWRAVDSQLPDRQFVLDAHCTDDKGLIVIAGSGGMVTRSTDWGVTWQRGRVN